MSFSGWVHVNVRSIVKITSAAMLVWINGQGKVWLPLSQIADAEDYEEGDADLTLSITDWIHRQKFLG